MLRILLKNGLIISVLCLLISLNDIHAQDIQVDNAPPNNDPTTLVEDVFIGGGCLNTSGITFSGTDAQIGYFTTANPAFGMTEGIVMSSGNVVDIVGVGSDFPSTIIGSGSDTDIEQLDIGGNLSNDCAILEFDFTPLSPTVTFNFAFASEEYLEWVNTAYNDAFGFFISGPGIAGPFSNAAINIAVIPGTTSPITIDNVNNVTNSAYYVNNPATGTLSALDGFTTTMEAIAENLTPCEEYHIKLAVCDLGDSSLDSAVFLEANSFSAGIASTVIANVPSDAANGTDAFEGCQDGYFEINIDPQVDDVDITFTINDVPGVNDATIGVDYDLIYNGVVLGTGPDFSITIPAGITLAEIFVQGYEDFVPEGIEPIELQVTVSDCECNTPDPALMNIYDSEESFLGFSAGDQTICEGGDAILLSTVSGSDFTPYDYTITNTNTGTVISSGEATEVSGVFGIVETVTNIPTTTTYDIVFTDACGRVTDPVSIVITVTTEVDATITDVGPYCETDGPINLSAASGGGTWSGPGITDATTGTFDPATAYASGPGPYTITYDIPANPPCEPDNDVTDIIVNPQAVPNITPAGPFCDDAAAVFLTSDQGGGTWSGPGIVDATAGEFDPATAFASGPSPYTITYDTSGGGCGGTNSINIEIGAAVIEPTANGYGVCINATLEDIVASGVGTNFNWYNVDPTGGGAVAILSNSATFSGADQIANGVDAAVAGSSYDFWVTESIGAGCEGPPTQVTILINDTPIAPTAMGYDICLNESLQDIVATGTGIVGNTFNWYDTDPTVGGISPIVVWNDTFSTTDQTNAGIDPGVEGSTEFWVTEFSTNGCESAPTMITINITNAPLGPMADGYDICLNGTLLDIVATGSANPANTINWYNVDPTAGGAVPVVLGNATLSTTDQTTNLVDPASIGTHDFWVTETTDSGCESLPTQVTINITDLPAGPLADGYEICLNASLEDIVATGSGNPAYTFNWYDTDPSVGGIVPIILGGSATLTTAEQLANGVDVATIGNYDFWITEVTDTNCESEATQVSVSIIDQPLPPTADGYDICVGEPLQNITATGSGNPAYTFNWYDVDPTGGGASPITNGLLIMDDQTAAGLDPLTAGGPYDFWVTEISDSGCESLPTQITININEVPDLEAVDNPIICTDGDEIDLDSLIPIENNSLIGTGQWYGGIDNTGSPLAGLQAANVGDQFFYEFITDNNCSANLSIVVEGVPEIIINVGATICVDATTYSVEITVNGGENGPYDLSGTAISGTNPTSADENMAVTLILDSVNPDYNIIATDINGNQCSSIEYNIITPNCNCPTADAASIVQAFCDVDDSALDLTENGPTGLGNIDNTDGTLNTEDTDVVPNDGVEWFTTPTPMIGVDTPYSPGATTPLDFCTPGEVELYAFLRCDLNANGFDGSNDDSYVPMGSILVYVFPTINVNETPGGCITGAGSCPDYEINYTVSSDGVNDGSTGTGSLFTADPNEVGSVTYTITDPNPNRPADCNDVTAIVDFDCPPNCPTDPMITIDQTEVCSGETVTISSSYIGPTGATATFEIQDQFGSIIIDGEPFDLPENLGCTEIVYTFTATAICDSDGQAIPETTPGDLTVEVVVYPSLFELQTTEGECGTAALLVVLSADGSECDSALGETPTNPQCGSDTTNSSPLIYTNTFFAGTTCEQTYDELVNADCASEECTPCPSTTDSPITEELCSGDTPNLPTVSLNNPNDNEIEWFDGNPNEGANELAFVDFTNNSCSEISITLEAYILCDDDEDENTPDVYVNLNFNHIVTIYPAPFTMVATEGECDVAALVVILSAAGVECDSEIGDTPIPLDCSTGGTASSPLTYTNTFFAGSLCEQIFDELVDAECTTEEPPICDDNDCNTEDSFDNTNCECVFDPITPPDCNDDNCATIDTYDAANCECTYEDVPPLDCDDGDCLTADVYNVITCECENNPIEPGACDDGDCNTEDSYDVDLCECVFVPIPEPNCDDANCGTEDSYDSSICECVNIPLPEPNCDDADCGTIDSYDVITCECINEPVAPLDCDDGDCATEDSFDTLVCECVHTPIEPLDCDDGDCNTEDSYDAASCTCINDPIEPLDCDDGDCNTEDSYDTATCACINDPIEPLDCDDGDCLTADVFNIQTCECENNPITPDACDDGDCTTEDSYDVDLCECVFEPLPEPDCNDDDCNTEDSFNSLTCECINDPIEPLDCDDGDCSTEDSYDTATCSCINTPVEPLDCDDGDCNTEDSYDTSICECIFEPFPEPDCNDDNCATIDNYDTSICECVYEEVPPLDCDDGDCLTADVYNIATCECENNPIEPGACDDGDCTTEDSYDVDLCECVFEPLPEPDCNDDDCNTEDSFNSLTCECINDPIEPLDCDDGDCNTEDSYDAATCSCINDPIEPLDCDDGDCNTEDSYDAATCSCINVPIEPLDCDDNDCLTADVYNIQTCECENNPITPGACDDGDCTTEDSYDIDLCECVFEPLPEPDCNDEDCSTEDSFNSLTCECINDPIEPLDCDDNDCGTVDTYDETICECVYAPIEPGSCDDDDCNTEDSYDEALCECVFTPIPPPNCDDGDCNTEDSYDESTCECINAPIEPLDCDDGDCNTEDSYDAATCSCINIPIPPPDCNDDDCTTEDSYDESTCECTYAPIEPLDCDDGDCLTADVYNIQTCECEYNPIEPGACDDGDCTTEDSYNEEICECVNLPLPPPDCDDGDCNTEDSFDSLTCECINDPIEPLDCDDGDCNTEDSYDALSCSCINTPLPPPNCDDNDCNTADSYNEATCECINDPIEPLDCDDGDCNTEDSYDAATCSCINTPLPPPNCDDNDCNTADSYDEATCSCINDPIPPPDCDDNNCATIDTYDTTNCECVYEEVPPLNCDDGDCLTADVYNIQTCECENNPIEPGACDDGDCTTEDAYDETLCECVYIDLPPPNCDDNDCNTVDSYNTETCECINDPIAPPVCDDNDCNTEDSYDTATCECVYTAIPPPDCDDNDCTTTDSYDAATCSCINTPQPPPVCDDNDCNTEDSFDEAICECVYVVIPPPNCDDNNCNTTDTYDTATCSCTNTPIPPPDCDDNDCTTADSYDSTTCECIYEDIPPLDCDDGDCLTADVYNIQTCECENNPIEPGACDDGDCTTEDAYDETLCECVYTDLPPPNCDDEDCSTEDSYNTLTCECINEPIEPPNCDDGDCGTVDSYDAANCECINDPIEPGSCDDEDCNTEDSYDETLCECVFTPIPPPDCDDNDCSTIDTYDPSICECVYEPIEPGACDDNDCNTADSYDETLCECVFTPIPPPDCNDDNCATIDTYDATTCECTYEEVPPLDCDDGDCLTADVYNIQTCECENNPIEPGACDDGDCTTEDAYDETLCECVYTDLPPPDCDDNDCNTEDSYDTETCECINDPIEPPLCDDDDCGTEDSYDPTTCECVFTPIEPPLCDDNDCNTADSYDAATCECVYTAIPPPDCDDEDCNTEDSYDEATCECVYTDIPPPDCNDDDCNTADVYNIQTCECENNPIEPGACDDGDCTTEDSYDLELCECVNAPIPPPNCDDGDCTTADSFDSLTCECINDPIDPTIDATIDQSLVCDGTVINLSLSANPDIGANLEWQLPDGSTSSGTELTYTAISNDPCGETQTITYNVSCEDTGNLIDSGSLDVTIYPDITATTTDGICTASISTDCPSFTATWTDAQGNSGSGFEYAAELGNSGAVTFTVINTDAPTDCSEAIFIANYDCPLECTDLDATTLAPTTDLCNDEAGFNLNSLLGTTATTGGIWTSPNAPAGTITGNTFNPSGLEAASYTLVYTVYPPATDPDFCEPASTSQQIEVMQAPFAEVGTGMNVCNDSTDGNTIVNFNTFVSNSNTAGTWTDINNSGATGNFSELDFDGVIEGNYQFMYTLNAEAPCEEVSYIVNILVEDCSFKIAIPNAFTPNNDGVNDGFRIVTNRVIDEYELHIFDRWGVNIFSSNDPDVLWDGTYKGEAVDLGVYVFYTYIKVQGEEDARTYKGNVTVIR